MLAGSFYVAVTMDSAWDTWRINWLPNLLSYFAWFGWSLCLYHYLRSIVLRRLVSKEQERLRTNATDQGCD